MLKVISLGNRLRKDDGVGPLIVEELRKNDIPVPVTLFDAGSDAFTLLEHLSGSEPLVLIDAARMGKNPGDVVRLQLNDRSLSQMDRIISLHGFGFADVYRMARGIGRVADCTFIGIEPKSIDFGESLSDEVRASVPAIMQMVMEEASKHGK